MGLVSQGNYKDLLPSLRQGTVGLVLCGGGFKGAYQVGVWKALTDPRIGITKFHCIAGTSVGALNCFLIANNDIPDAEKVWAEKDILKWSVKAIGSYIVAFALLFGPFVVMALALGIAFSDMSLDWLAQSRDAVLLRGFNPEAALAVALLVFPLGPWLFEHRRPESVVWVILPLFFALAMVGEKLAGLCVPVTHFIGPNVIAVAPVFIAAICYYLEFGIKHSTLYFVDSQVFHGVAAAFLMAGIIPYLSVAIRWPLGFLIAGIILVMLVGSVGIFLGRAAAAVMDSAHKNAQLLSNTGLLNAIRSRLSLAKVKSSVQSVFISLAVRRMAWDPFIPNIAAYGIESPIIIYDTENPDSRTGWWPLYVDLCQADSTEDAVELLRQTSALPFILKGGTTKDGDKVVDGGIIDNLPITPVLTSGAEYIIVVHLRPFGGCEDERRNCYDDHFRRTWKGWFLSTLSMDEAKILYQRWFGRWRSVGSSEFWDLLPPMPILRDDQIITIAPRRALATVDWFGLRFLTGTLNLSVDARANWMKMGYQDTLNAFGILPGENTGSPLATI